jgi:alkyl sulfatase BDS1-like metallo-beta-lactamase superfamily hydrolase
MATSAREFFNERVPAALAAHPERAKEVAAVYLFRIAGSEGGTWTANLAAVPPWCRAGGTDEAQCTIDVSDHDFRAMLDGGVQVAMQVLLAGRLKIAGDPALIAKLTKVLQMGDRDCHVT